MGYLKWANNKIKGEMDYYDIKLLKIMAFCIGIPVGAFFSNIVLPYWWVFILVSVLAHLRPWYHAFKRKS